MSSSAGEEAARAALRFRQGSGARYDAPAAPAGDLLLARRGTAYFARKLNELGDADLDGASLRDGWTRRHLIAHVAYHARALAHLFEEAAVGVDGGVLQLQAVRAADVEDGATLPAVALRHLFRHTEVHLNVRWRDLSDAGWEVPVLLPDQRRIAIRDIPLMRAREAWSAAIALNNGGRRADIPPGVERA